MVHLNARKKPNGIPSSLLPNEMAPTPSETAARCRTAVPDRPPDADLPPTSSEIAAIATITHVMGV
jgi:hypothetical protein